MARKGATRFFQNLPSALTLVGSDLVDPKNLYERQRDVIREVDLKTIGNRVQNEIFFLVEEHVMRGE